MLRDLEREREHRLLPVGDVGFAVVRRDLVGHQRILAVDAQDRSVRDDAVQAIVGTAGRDDDHFPFAFRKTGVAQHQRIVVGEERAAFVRTMRQRQKHVRYEPCLFLHFEHAGA